MNYHDQKIQQALRVTYETTGPNKAKTSVQWFRMSHAVLAGFSGHGNSIYKFQSSDKLINSFSHIFLAPYFIYSVGIRVLDIHIPKLILKECGVLKKTKNEK